MDLPGFECITALFVSSSMNLRFFLNCWILFKTGSPVQTFRHNTVDGNHTSCWIADKYDKMHLDMFVYNSQMETKSIYSHTATYKHTSAMYHDMLISGWWQLDKQVLTNITADCISRPWMSPQLSLRYATLSYVLLLKSTLPTYPCSIEWQMHFPWPPGGRGGQIQEPRVRNLRHWGSNRVQSVANQTLTNKIKTSFIRPLYWPNNLI